MTREEAATILRNTAWLGSNAEREKVEEAIEVLASAQSEPTTKIREILEYLDTTLHPIVSPDNWNVYSELHDMVSKLPSAQPEQCDYCTEDSDGYVKPVEKNCHAFIRCGMNGWELSMKANGWHGSAKIRYCPMCGRRLERG